MDPRFTNPQNVGRRDLFLPANSASLDQRLIERIEFAFPEASLKIVQDAKVVAFRDSLHMRADVRRTNSGDIFKTGLFESVSHPPATQD